MIQRVLILLIISFASTYAHAENALEGHWVGLDNKSIVEFNDNEIMITIIGDHGNTEIKATIEKIVDSRYQIKHQEKEVSAVITVDWNQEIFSIQNLQGHFNTLNFKPAPQISPSDMVGTWYSHDKTNEYESSTIIIQNDSSYDYDSLEINHAEKNYSRQIDKNNKFSIKDGFIFVEKDSDDEEESIYYLTSYTKNTLNYTDFYGQSWVEYKKEGANHIDIPEGYTKKQEKD